MTSNLIDMILSTGGIDKEGTSNLIKDIYGIENEEELPEQLPMTFLFEFEKAH